MNSSKGAPMGSHLGENLCRFKNVSGELVLVSCTGGVVAQPQHHHHQHQHQQHQHLQPPLQNDTYDEYDSYYDYEHSNLTDEQWSIVRQLNLYYVPLLIVVGFVGNLLSCVVFLNTRLRMRSSSYYLAALAIADVTYLFILFLVWLDLLGFNTFNINVMCQIQKRDNKPRMTIAKQDTSKGSLIYRSGIL
nr:uncharacterized protein LOC113799931 [Penaeus vannamei]